VFTITHKILYNFILTILKSRKNNKITITTLIGLLETSLIILNVNSLLLKEPVKMRGKGHYYKNHNVENQKEHRKICKPSQRQKWLLS
jgi:hypothetical protein